ncbi:MAG: hypothetical protein AAB289_16650, partial [Chloroflexota bacterium]
MWTGAGKVALVGVGYSALTRSSEGALGARAVEAAENAVSDAGLRLADIDGLAAFPEAPYRGAGGTAGIDLVSVEYHNSTLTAYSRKTGLAPFLKLVLPAPLPVQWQPVQVMLNTFNV